MAKLGVRKIFAGVILVVGIVLMCMYAILAISGGRPSGGMLVVGIVDLVVGVVLLRRVKEKESVSA